MKKQTGIWIDSSKAIVVTLTDGDDKLLELDSAIENRVYHDKEGDQGSFMGDRHINNDKTFGERKSHQIEAFLTHVLTTIKGTDEIYVCGPADMKFKLKQKIERDSKLAYHLKLVEAAESMTNKQLIAKVKKFYKI